MTAPNPNATEAERAANLRLQQDARASALAEVRSLRKQAANEIERLLAFLDQSDIDPDLEDDREQDDADLEPSLCGVTAHGLSVTRHCSITGVSPVEDGEQESDDEPSLGSIEDHPNGYYDGSDATGRGRSQERWASGNRDDCEGDEHDGAEPENEGGEAVHEDDEPSLGWTIDGCMTGRSFED